MHGSGSRAAPGARNGARTGAHYGASSDGRDWRKPRSRQSRQRAHFGYPRHRLRVCTAPRSFTGVSRRMRVLTTAPSYHSPQVLSVAGAGPRALVTLARLRRRAPERHRTGQPLRRAVGTRPECPPRRRYGRPPRRRRTGQPLRRDFGTRPRRAAPLVYRYDVRRRIRRRMQVLTTAPPHTPPGATLDIFVGADPNQGLSTRAAAAPALAAAPAAPAAGTARDDTVHIFSLASGLLYERFLRIMMKTAVERASRPLKFWILGNFLSPAFRHAVNSGALATAVGAQVIASLIRWRSCSTTGHLIAYVFVCV